MSEASDRETLVVLKEIIHTLLEHISTDIAMTEAVTKVKRRESAFKAYEINTMEAL